MAVSAFGEPVGQGWTQVAELAIAFALSLLIGLEREAQQKSAGMRTYTLVGLGAALFVQVSKYGFSDILGTHVTLDPSRVAAQIVTGVGFIGGGLIFVRRDAVRGLTTAASVWVTAAVGSAAGAGLPVLAAVTTGMYFLVLYGLRPLARQVRRLQPDTLALRISYADQRGLLREILKHCTEHGFAVAELTTTESTRGDQTSPTVEVIVSLTGRGDLAALTGALRRQDGVFAVAAADPNSEASSAHSSSLTTATRPTMTMTARSTAGGSRRPTRAPITPPRIEPAAISPAAAQSMCAVATNTIAATKFTNPASTFFKAFCRCSDSASSRPRNPISSTPCAAPK
jgi:putative Mg2+ transporter-C (MgtC) family protein